MKIYGHTVSTPVAKSNWNEDNEKRSSFIENKPPLKNGADGIPYFETPVIVESPTADNHATTKGYVDNAVASAVNFIKQSDLRSVIRSDSSATLVKEVPANAMPFAQVRSVGGMTYDCGEVVYSKNLCDINTIIHTGPVVIQGGTVTVENGVATFTTDGTYKVGDTTYVALGTVRTVFPSLEAGKTYTLSYDGVTTLSGMFPNMIFFLGNGNGASIFTPVETEMYGISGTFIADETTLNYTLLAVSGTVSNLMLNEGDTPLPYDPFGATYTIYEDTKVTAVESVGKNLFSFFTGVYGRCGVRDISENSATVVCSDASNYSARCFTIPEWLGGKTVTVTGNWIASGNNIPGIRLMWMKGTNASTGSTLFLKNSGESATVVVPEKPADADALRVYLYGNTTGEAQAGDTVTYTNVQVEIGSTATEFEPYREPITLPIPAEVQALDGYGIGIPGGAYNSIEWGENGKVTFVKRVARKTFDGTESGWYAQTNANGLYVCLTLYDNKQGGTLLSNLVTPGKPSYVGVPCTYTSGTTLIIFPGHLATTLAEWRAKLAEWVAEGTPLTLYYDLAEPVVTDISDLMTEDNLLKVYEGGTIAMANSLSKYVPSTIDYQFIEFA